MGAGESGSQGRGAVYAVSFKEKYLGSTCDIEIEVDVKSKTAEAFLSMRSIFKSSPPFRVSRDQLYQLSSNIKLLSEKAALLESMPDGGEYQQLAYHSNGMSVVVVHPIGAVARYSLSIGSYSRSGLLGEMSSVEIDRALTRIDELIAIVLRKVT